MAKRLLFVPITKVDVEKREVWGQAVAEVADKSGEIFDYDGSRPYFDDWSAAFEKATDGKSLGNIRAMHGKVAAGKVIAYLPNDAEKVIDIGTKIVDDAEWAKVEEGVYTGFSIGGDYVKRWKDGAGLTRYIAQPSEISIVDNPCVPTATFSVIKADGVTEERAFAPSLAEPLRKGLWSVARLASLLQDVQWLASDEAWDAEIEGDGSPIPAQLRDWLSQGVTILSAMVTEEGAEAVADLPGDDVADVETVDVVELSAPSGDVEKAATPETPAADPIKPPAPASDDERIAAIVAKALGASREAEKAADLAKAIDAAVEKATGALRTELADTRAALDALKAHPAAPKGAVRAVPVPKVVDSVNPKTDPAPAADPVEVAKARDTIAMIPGLSVRKS